MARKRLERLRPGDVLPLVEERFMGANGRELELEASSTLFTYAEHPSVLVLLRDIAARKQAERKRQEAEVRLQETQDLLQSIVANLPISVFLKDGGELRFVLWNKAGTQMVGIPEAEALNKTAYDLFPEEQASRFTRDDRRALEQRLQLLVDLLVTHLRIDVVRHARVHGRAAPRVGDGDDRIFLRVLDLDQRGRILRDMAAVGDDQRHRLADVSHARVGQRRGLHVLRREICLLYTSPSPRDS